MSRLKDLPSPNGPVRGGEGAELTYRGVPDGSGTEVILLPRFRSKVSVGIHAWATGYGDPDYEGSTADLLLMIDDVVVERAHDERFTFYNLAVDHTKDIEARTQTKITISFKNLLATEAGDLPHGVLAKLKVLA